MKIIFMGTDDFAWEVLHALYDSGEEILAAVSQPDRPRGRHLKTEFTKVKEGALALGLKVLQPVSPSDPDFISRVRALGPDVIVVASYGRILKKELLEISRYGCLNVHASLLPRWRGAAPANWAVVSGDEESGVTIMQMQEGLDTGDILLQASVRLSADETGGSLLAKLSHMGGELIVQALKKLEKGELKPIPQDERKATYAPILKKEDGRVDFGDSAIAIWQRVRGLSPWPGCFAFAGGRRIRILSVRPVDTGSTGTDILKAADFDREDIRIEPETAHRHNQDSGGSIDIHTRPGTVVTRAGRMFVACGDGFLEILKIQPEGKKAMDAADFLKGHRIAAFDD